MFHNIVKVCPWWLTYAFDNPLRRIFHNPQKILEAYIKKGAIVADIGCGMGYFSLGLAKLVGENGLVIAVDIQQQQLDVLKKRAIKTGVAKRINLHLGKPEKIDIKQKVDFTLAFWMIHEVLNRKKFLEQIFSLLKPEAKFLFVEPKIHVSKSSFEETVNDCRKVGFKLLDAPNIFFSRAVLLGK